MQKKHKELCATHTKRTFKAILAEENERIVVIKNKSSH